MSGEKVVHRRFFHHEIERTAFARTRGQEFPAPFQGISAGCLGEFVEEALDRRRGISINMVAGAEGVMVRLADENHLRRI